MVTIKTNKPYKIYANFVEDGALKQFEDVMQIDWVIRGALMPDAHQGYSLPIGGVVATDSVISPQFVGYDIGCGMCAAKFDGLKKANIDSEYVKDYIFNGIYNRIPVGFNRHETMQDGFELPIGMTPVVKDIVETKNPLFQLGTLGGGNHFIEIGYDENDDVWAILHSGSRHFGHNIATHYMKLAHPEGKAKDGNFGFDVRSEEGLSYINDMNLALDFALANRKKMLDAISKAVGASFVEESFINRNHNHAEFSHFMWIHRKGATHAEEGMMGVIPGNMRDGSFIVRGKGNSDSLWSSSHGAGRVLGRKAAKRELNMDEFKEQMVGIKGKVDNEHLDEAPGAYKNIFDVMDQQKDLVEIIHHIRPIINVKG